MTRDEIIDALELLLADSAARAELVGREGPPVERLGNQHEHFAQVIRRLGAGQVVAISPRVVWLIVKELRDGEPIRCVNAME